MITHGDGIGKKDELARTDSSVASHRIQLAKSILLVNLPDIAFGRSTTTVLNTTMHPSEPVFTREVV